jgi:PAS domain-containing protein
MPLKGPPLRSGSAPWQYLQEAHKSHREEARFSQGIANQKRRPQAWRDIVKSGHPLAAARSEACDCAYNLFRNKSRPEILCAVPEDYPIPSFISSEQWTYVGSLRSGAARPPGFCNRAATTGVRFNGFYLFQVTAAEWTAQTNSIEMISFPRASLAIRQHVREALLRLLAQHGSPDQVIAYVSRFAADQKAGETRYADLLATLPFAAYTTDARGRITFYNKAAVALWGRRPVLGRDRWCGSWHIYSPNGAPLPHDRCPMAVAIREDRKVRGVSAVAERPDGTRVHFMPFPTPLHDANANLVGAVNVLLDLGAA